MAEYIDREAALLVFGNVHPLDYNTLGYISKIRSIPAANVMEKRSARWEKIDRCDVWRCSACKEVNLYAYSCDCDDDDYVLQDSYCPKCGAKMEEQTDG